MARVNLIYFGSVKDVTGMSAETIDAPSSLAGLKSLLMDRYPSLAASTFRFSVNRRLVEEDKALSDGDEVALLPPFAGG